MTTVLKLGGSVITEKDSERTVADERLEGIVRAIDAATTDDLVLILGGGSFGHPAAARHGVSETAATRDPTAVTEIHGAMLDLTSAVVERLLGRGVPAVPMHPLSMASRAGGTVQLQTAIVDRMVTEGFVPVLHGDGVVTEGAGVTVLSGDDIVVQVAQQLSDTHVGLCTRVPGVLDQSGSVIDRIERFDEVASVVGTGEATDVTGGMAGKVRTILDHGITASVFDVDGLALFLGGGRPGTTVGVDP